MPTTTLSVYVTTELHEKRMRSYLGNCACVLAGHKQREEFLLRINLKKSVSTSLVECISFAEDKQGAYCLLFVVFCL